MSTNCTDPVTGKPRLLSKQCATCIGRPGNLMDLRPGRVAEMVNECLTRGGWFPCHETIMPGATDPPAVCRWLYDKYGPRINLIRVMSRLGGFTEVDPPA